MGRAAASPVPALNAQSIIGHEAVTIARLFFRALLEGVAGRLDVLLEAA